MRKRENDIFSTILRGRSVSKEFMWEKGLGDQDILTPEPCKVVPILFQDSFGSFPAQINWF